MIFLLAFVLIPIIILLILDGIINKWAYSFRSICFDIIVGFLIGFCAWFYICVIFSPNPSVKTEENAIIINETKYELIEKHYENRDFYLVQQLDNTNDLSYSYDYLNKEGQICHNEINAIDVHIYYISEDENPYVIKKEHDSMSKFKRNFFVNMMSDTYDFYIPEKTVLTYETIFTD